MALPSLGAISMADYNIELKQSTTAQVSLNDTNVRKLLGKTTASSTISMSDGYGRQAVSQQTYDNTWTTSGTFTVPANFSTLISLEVYVIGGGGQAAGWPSGAEGGGGAEGAYLYLDPTYPFYSSVIAGAYSIAVGLGGTSAYCNGCNGGNGGNSVFASGTDLATVARGGLGGYASGGAVSRNHAANGDWITTGIKKQYFLGGATSGRFGVANSSSYGGGGGASNCYDANGDGVYNDGGTSSIGAIFGGNGQGGAGCGGGDRRTANAGYFPGGGGGGADSNATGGNGGNGAIRVVMKYWGT